MSMIEVNHVVKEYRLGQMQGLRASVKRLLGARSGQPQNRLKALDGVDFKVEAGEVLGIIGTNGAGKSTLLKVLAGITTPTTGSMVARGRVAPLIEVGAGLIADLTGRENIFLNGVILGMRVKEIKSKFDEIVAFAELEDFIDTPIKRYSSGMAVRLGFAIATSVDADILIVDEVLAVGDVAFQRKCFDRMEELIKGQGKTVLLVSHNIRQVERLCTRGILLEHGRVLMDGDATAACEMFYQRSDEKIQREGAKRPTTTRWGNTLGSTELVVQSMDLLDHAGCSATAIMYKRDFSVRVRFAAKAPIDEPVLGFGIHTPDLLYLATHNSDNQITATRLESGDYEATCTIAACPLLPGVYAIRIGITEGSTTRTLFYGENLIHFQVLPNPEIKILNANRSGFFELNARWTNRPDSARGERSRQPTPDMLELTVADSAD